MNENNSLWVEKYRPDTLEGYVCSVEFEQKLQQYITDQDIPHLLFYGKAGTGKTTAAKIIINNIESDVKFINASDERGIDTIRDKVKSFAVTTGFKPLKIVVLDEMDAITPDGQRALRNLMETYSDTTRFVLTANYVERIIEPLISRSQVVKLTPPTKKDVAKRLAEILKNENIEYDVNTVKQLVNAYYPDIRKVINTAQYQTRDGKLQVSVEELIGQDFKLKMIDILTSNLPLKDMIAEIRKLVADNQIQDFIELYQILFEHVETYAPSRIPQVVKAIGEGLRWDTTVADKEINFVTTLYEILTN